MTKFKYDVRGVEAGGSFDDTPVPKGVYRAVIDECTFGKSKSSGNDMLSLTFKISRGDHKGRLAWDYITFADSQKPKMRALLEACGIVRGKKERGEIDTTKIEGTEVQIRIKHEDDEEYGLRHKVATIMAMPEDEDDDLDDDDEEDETDADDLDDEDEDEDEDEEDDDDEEGDGEEYTMADLEALDRAGLKALIKDEELDIRVTKGMKDDAIREKVAEELDIEEDDDGEDEDYNDWDVPALKAELKERGLKVSGSKKALVTRLEESDAEEDDDDDGDEPF